MSLIELNLAHSPDPDDAFMWWPLQKGKEKIDCEGFVFNNHAFDIEVLNKKSTTRNFDITALSCATYPKVSNLYGITSCGASIGNGYGPKLVSSVPKNISDLSGANVAIPGMGTTATCAFKLRLGNVPVNLVEVPFDEIGGLCLSNKVDAGIVIHEEQLTYESNGLYLIEDLGKWWKEEYEKMLPLGLNCVALDLENIYGEGTLARLNKVLKRSINFAIKNSNASMDFALQYGRGIMPNIAKEFVDMYVNNWTLDFGLQGREGIEKFYEEAVKNKIFDFVPEITFIN